MKTPLNAFKRFVMTMSILAVTISLPAGAENTLPLFSQMTINNQNSMVNVTINQNLKKVKIGDSLQFTFNGQSHTLIVNDIELSNLGQKVIVGSLDSHNYASVLTLSDAGLLGYLVGENETWSLTLNQQGQWFHSSYNQNRQAVKVDEGGLLIPNRSSVAEPLKPTRELTVNGMPVIDVMVLWDQALESRLGSKSAVQTLISQRIAMTNQAFLDSEINAEVRFVYGEKRDYSRFVSNASLLDTLQANNGVFSGIESLRTEHGADAVIYLRQFTVNSGSAGIAYRLGDNGQMTSIDNRYAYSVVTDGEYTQNGTVYYSPENTFSHELGHNLGAEHDHSHAGGEMPIYSYAFGHDVPGEFATIMSYDEPPVMRYSNPDILCTDSLECGVEEGQPFAADNARTFNQTAQMVANFKTSVYEYDQSNFIQMEDSTTGEITVSYIPNNSLVYSFVTQGLEASDISLNSASGVSILQLLNGAFLRFSSNGEMTISNNCCVLPKSGFDLPVHYDISQNVASSRLTLTSDRLEF